MCVFFFCSTVLKEDRNFQMVILRLLVHCGIVIFSNPCHLAVSLMPADLPAKISWCSQGVLITSMNEQGPL